MALRIGVDSGGTFTDVCLFDEKRQLDIWKVPSTPDDPSRGISDGVSEGLATVGSTSAHVVFLGHGTTVATNALIELKGVATGLITTDGFRDLLEIGRQKRPSLYDMNAEKPETLVSRDRRQESRTPRMRWVGGSRARRGEAARGRRKLAEEDVKAIAVCFLCKLAHGLSQLLLVDPADPSHLRRSGTSWRRSRLTSVSGFSAFMS